MQNEGYDSVIREEDGVIWEYIAFSPNQIKSATNNVGTYNANNPDIRYSLITPEMDAAYLDAAETQTITTSNGDMIADVNEATGRGASRYAPIVRRVVMFLLTSSVHR